MPRERIQLSVASDLSVTALQFAAALLGETPKLLYVSPEEDHAEEIGNVTVTVDTTLRKWAWLLVGETREVYSDGA